MNVMQLCLLIPDKLPTQRKISENNQQSISLSLTLAMQSLDLDCQAQAIANIDRALALLPTSKLFSPSLNQNNTRQYQEALDYDDYFNVRHVQSDEPDTCLLKSILVTYRCFLTLELQSNHFNSEKIEIQRQGFRVYFLLLARTYNLSLE